MASVSRRGGRSGGQAGTGGGGGAAAGGGNPSAGGGPGRGGGDMGNQRRGSWRGGPPGSMGYSSAARGGSPVGAPGGGGSPRVSINDHMNDMKKVQADKSASGVNKVFQTDTDISGPSRSTSTPRELQPWAAPETTPAGANGTTGSGPVRANGAVTPVPGSSASGAGLGAGASRGKDTETFGAASGDDRSSGKWDQFETNARLFGTKTSYQEEIYTTKLNKGGADFRQREKEAERLANEIMGQSSANTHVLDERNQLVEDWTKDDEEKYSGVQRGPGAYVPPAARRSQGGPAGASGLGGYAAAAAAAAASGKPHLVPSAVPANGVQANGASSSPVPAPAVAIPGSAQASGSSTVATATAASATSVRADAATGSSQPTGSTAASTSPPKPVAKTTSPKQASTALTSSPSGPSVAVSGDAKESLDKVVGAYRQFVDSEKERVEAKKQSMAKSERERQLADLKKFQASFKVPLPMPQDILPILSKDQERQKDIAAKAQSSLQAAKAEAEAKKQVDAKLPPAPSVQSPPPATSALRPSTKKIPMHIVEIPPFNPAKRKPSTSGAQPAVPSPLPISDSAKTNIPQVTSPTPAASTLSPAASGATGTAAAVAPSASPAAGGGEAAKLNPKASAFVFKPTAAAFKPGQSSNTSSPAVRAPQVAAAGPSVPKNPFFGDHVPGRVAVDLRADFNPFKHAPVASASTISPLWPYTGRPVQMTFFPAGQPMMYEMSDDMASPHFRPPQVMPNAPAGYPPYYRYGQQPGMPPMQQGQLQGQGQGQGQPGGIPQNPMFSPGPGYAQLPGGMPQHLGGGLQGQQQQLQHPPGMPIYYQNGIPQNPQYLPQHMQQFGMGMHQNLQQPQSPHQQHRGGGGGGSHYQGLGGPGPGPGQSMYYTQGQLPTPQHTPQMQPNLPFPPGSANGHSSGFQPSPRQNPSIPQSQQQSQGSSPAPGPGLGPGAPGYLPHQQQQQQPGLPPPNGPTPNQGQQPGGGPSTQQ